ncbi:MULTISPECIES: arginase family protein [unclassified Mesorhizobium]|uniref:arginase family protein n=1 Tax=unclassified Mesorhizobium TaxID=325217 RepID=UPI000BB05108|nr:MULTISPECIES: arginase family protein [unclassified Mesorhizobium]TGT60590.1 arginase family protein [Mesorhizobium sp. M00.F.Ca.ET.170.01.1.1]AZO10309.1 arginase family protein [Mesorhizobium sp. M3A.F.Ca.ET.080.04.2.1]PBB87835.1 arginase [Mesorhizobium sp. WSM3876]RWE27132.1 MAG: arginase family protein [Mesorhizobium sp.]RWE34668.1 MAG: arginase family protein [Mesorhizobium sp.]
MKVSIILASYDSGHYHGGWGQGPDALISGGLADALRLAGHEVDVHDIGKVVEDEQEREIGTGFAVCNAVSGEVRIALDNGRFPIVLAGNCLTSAGAVAGEGADAIIWADQHGDLNTPDTSTSGLLDGMALATVLGLCWRRLAMQIPGFKPIDPARCVLVDARDLDPAEKELLDRQPILRTECPGWAGVAETLNAAGAERVHMHLDLDVHDPEELQANHYSTPGGPAPEQVRSAICGLAGRLSIAGLTISAYDPAFDAKGEVPPLVGGLLVDLLATLEKR